MWKLGMFSEPLTLHSYDSGRVQLGPEVSVCQPLLLPIVSFHQYIQLWHYYGFSQQTSYLQTTNNKVEDAGRALAC